MLLARDGSWWPAREPLAATDAFPPKHQGDLRGPLRPGAGLDCLIDQANVQVVFPLLHGPFGEDGTVQGMLELYRMPFVGSGCAASAVAMDKLRTRQAYLSAGIPTANAYEPSVPWSDCEPEQEFAQMQRAIGTPAFCKVDASGSTFGVHRITEQAELSQFLMQYRGQYRRWFAEQAVAGEEITVAVLGNTGSKLQALPPVGIYPVDDDWFTHDAKYRPGATEEVVPPRGMCAQGIREVQDLAIRCHELLVCDGLSRTDMIITKDGPIVLETNTIPGLTETSLLPRAAAAAGMSLSQLTDHLLELALAHSAVSFTTSETIAAGDDRASGPESLDGAAAAG